MSKRKKKAGALALTAGTEVVAMTSPRIALVLGGGGARGLAHIPVLEALDELGLRPVMIAGTSIGAVCGWPYAAGMSGKELRAHTASLLMSRTGILQRLRGTGRSRLLELAQLAPWGKALLSAELVLEIIAPEGIAKTFETLTIPLQVVATDFHGQAQVVFSSGAILPAVAASMAIPGLFAPVMVQKRAHVDGGLVNPLPVDLVVPHADITIAVAVNGIPLQPDAEHLPSAIETLSSSFQIIERSLMREKLKTVRPDILLEPAIDRFRTLDFLKAGEILAAAEPIKEQLKRALALRMEGPGSVRTPRATKVAPKAPVMIAIDKGGA
jgi:NTE family protein